jgi:PAS domain S-box-containing protein
MLHYLAGLITSIASIPGKKDNLQPGSDDKKREFSEISDLTGYLAAIPLIALTGIFLVQLLLANPFAYVPPLLNDFNLLLNIGFIILALAVAWGTLRTGRLQLAWMGAGIMVLGVAIVFANLFGIPVSINAGVQIQNIGVALAGALHLAGTLIAFFAIGVSRPGMSRRVVTVAGTYGGGIGAMIVVTSLSVVQVLPAFFVPGLGGTPIRQVTLLLAIVLFAVSAGLVFLNYTRSKSGFQYLYGLGLASVTLGQMGYFFSYGSADIMSWIGRLGQWSGSFYFLAALVVILRQVRDPAVSTQGMLDNLFSPSNVMYKFLLESSSDAMIGLDKEGIVMLWNAAAERILGYQGIEAIGQNFEHLTEIPLQGYESPDSHTGAQQRSWDFYHQNPEGTGSWLSVSSTKKVVRGSPLTIITITDITDRKETEQALKESESVLQSFFNAPGDMRGIVELVADDDVRHIADNTEAAAFFGLTPDAIRNTLGSELGEPPGVLQMWIGYYNQSLQIGKPVTFEYLDPKGGSTSWLSATVSYLGAPHGYPRFAYAVRDITGQKQAEKALQEYAANLKQSNEDLERFAYVASHDLREPLRMVTSFSQLLAKNYQGRLDADADEFISYIVDGGRKMDALVHDLLEFSRITSRGKPFELTDMNGILGEVQKSLSVSIRENNATLTAGMLPIVSADRSQMALVFQNLISNAIKFRREDQPVITVDAGWEGNEWVFSVRDNGIGIDREYHEKIFGLFQRLHSRGEYSGTGIGLAICKRIIERHGGRIWVESEKGTGSIFFFTIPAETRSVEPGNPAGQCVNSSLF